MQNLFELHDSRTGDGLAVALIDGDRLELRTVLEGRLERVLLLVDGRRRARELAYALLRASNSDGDATATPCKVAL